MCQSETGYPNKNSYKIMKKLVERCHETADLGIKYVPLDTTTLRILLFTDAAFSNATNYSSQTDLLYF